MLDYREARGFIKNGDILLYEGKGLISSIIMKVQKKFSKKRTVKGQYSHAGMVVWWNKRLMVLEAVGKGVFPTPLSRNIKHYKGRITIWRASVSDSQRHKIIVFAQMEIGKEYHTLRLVLMFWKLIFGGADKKDEFRAENKLVCSQYVAAAYNVGGCDLRRNLADRFTKPNDIADSPETRCCGTLKE